MSPGKRFETVPLEAVPQRVKPVEVENVEKPGEKEGPYSIPTDSDYLGNFSLKRIKERKNRRR